VEGLPHRSEHLAQPRGLRRRQADGPDHLLRREAQQFSDRRRRTEYAGGAGDVPAGVVVRRIHGVADSRLGFEAEDEGMHEIASADRIRAGVGEQRRRDGRRGMAVVTRRRVVVVVDVRGDAVQERRQQRINPLGARQRLRRRRP